MSQSIPISNSMESVHEPSSTPSFFSDDTSLWLEFGQDALDEALALLSAVPHSDHSSTENQSQGYKFDKAQHKCTLCGSGFARRYDVARHHKTHHANGPITKHKCNRCCKSFSRKDSLFRHYKSAH
mmetsp:Transcript_9869/g.16957  ORF Transcript_9869/g.16957 Transcript_9869/m.16957 type:complete len:126 (-) Transcript_9869:76-453(-)